MTTESTAHQYQEEFGANFDLGFDLEAYPQLTDISFCQDACPQFYFSHDDKYFLVMVDHKDICEREDESSPRYLILNAYNSMTPSNPCICLDEDDDKPVLATEDTATFIAYIDSKRNTTA